VATRKNHQLDINLSSIKDNAVRSALDSIVSQVNALSQNISVSTSVKAQKISTHNELFKVDEDGMVRCNSLNIDGGGPIKMKSYSGTLTGGGTTTLSFPTGTKIMGISGWSQYDGNAGQYAPLGIFSDTVLAVYPSGSNSIVLLNDDAVDSNDYRIIVFYNDRDDK